MTEKLKTYSEVISYLESKKRQPHLLLGNGFSMAYNHEIFSYNALHRFIEEQDDPLITSLFKIIKTKNFELIMQQLDNFCELINAFGSNDELLEKIETASSRLKESLIDAVEALHPEHVFKLGENQIAKCYNFLSFFINNHGSIFSTNYDLLLYWVLMRKNARNAIDGFGRDREDTGDYHDEPEYSELRWGNNRKEQNIYYVHGALPIFDEGIHIIKEQYTGANYLLENIKKRIDKGHYPVFVASGNGEEKLNHILHNRYLTYCYESLCNIEGSLITFGFNFGAYDYHIIDAINIAAKQGRRAGKKLFSVYIGVYSDNDRKHIERIQDRFKCKVTLFDAKTTNIWA
ncbi:TPA: DUF4917 family protein [Aeromonas hydrophila]|uniref:DUF4917 family protein n=1 Tax=Aeromonas hydrophila TaxID=644 RepID=UPI000C3440D3|nr:DUF4917 family protein [Aeromonas hydrophila]PKD25090.1 hypothetical protein AO056_01572 [Aeromonas hydrophila]WRK93253.1 DUF4917 family protein [Aeromonas hydrophila]HAT2712285.1 DUF4917 family protein [Aeromonas hydrophila]